jgi:NAD(P)-dependent dehydrogenase (short-subunit alcohol dehydrogenase family)
VKHALITGGSSGIGLAVSRRLVAAGWQVTDLARSTGWDVTDARALRRHLASTHFDAAILCAGDVKPATLDHISDADWDHAFAVNVRHQFIVLAHLAKRHLAWTGPVVLIASTAGTRPSPGWGAYAAAKAALINLGLTASAELADRGIRVYTLAPGRCATALRKKLAPDEDPRTIMQPDEVAGVVMACIADTAGVLAGQVIEVARRG